MAKKIDLDRLYEAHKFHPDGKNSERHPTPEAARRADQHRHKEPQQPQHYENKPDHSGGKYWNDVGEKWTRGFGDPYPHFDHSDEAPRFNSSKGNTWPRQPSDYATSRQDGDRRHGRNQHRFQGGGAAKPERKD